MSNTTGVKKQELLILRVDLGSFPVFEEVHVARLFSLLCYVFCFVCLRPVCSILPVYLDFPFSIAPSVFSSVYTKYG